MYLNTTINPNTFSNDLFNLDDGYRVQAELLLQAILENCLLVMDSEGTIRNHLIEKIQSLPTKKGQHISTLFQEILKQKKRKTVECPNALIKCGPSDSINILSYKCLTNLNLECLVVSYLQDEDLYELLKGNPKVVPLEKYSNSDFEVKRRRYLSDYPPIDQLDSSEVERNFMNSTKFSKWIRFYDKQIGKGNNLANFRRGIEYLLNIWKKSGIYSKDKNCEVEIITTLAWTRKHFKNANDRKVTEDENRDKYNKVINDLIIPLKRLYAWPIKLIVKKNENSIFHARHIQTQHTILEFDLGFDFVKGKNSFRRCFVKVDNGAVSHLKECRSEIPDGFPPKTF